MAVRIGSIAATFLALMVATPGHARSETSPCQLAAHPEETVDLGAWPFGSREVIIESDPARSAWMALLRQISAEDVPLPRDWKPHLTRVRTEPLLAKLTVVNDLVNRIPYKRRVDWVHPRVFLKRGGDCDGAAVTKYMLLRGLGITSADMRIALVYWPERKARHAILMVRGKDEKLSRYILDINHARVVSAIYHSEYVPLMSVNENGVWRHKKTSARITNHFLNPRIIRP